MRGKCFSLLSLLMLTCATAAYARDDFPVVRANKGDIGMYFRLGGLANLVHDNRSHNIGPLLFSQVGLKFVFSEQWMLPIWFGTGMRVDSPETGDSSTNWGIDMGAAFEYHFRIWRRISPFFGAGLGFQIEDPTLDNNVKWAFDLGPNMGVEFYFADRVSLTAMYMFLVEIAHQDSVNPITSFSFATLAGGALNITYYF